MAKDIWHRSDLQQDTTRKEKGKGKDFRGKGKGKGKFKGKDNFKGSKGKEKGKGVTWFQNKDGNPQAIADGIRQAGRLRSGHSQRGQRNLLLQPLHRPAQGINMFTSKTMPIQGIQSRTHACHVNTVSLKVFSVGTNRWNIYSTWYDLSVKFDTRAAIHVCPWWFGAQFPTYVTKRHFGTVGADGTPIPVHRIRTISVFKMLPDTGVAVGIALTACDVQEPIISFSQML